LITGYKLLVLSPIFGMIGTVMAHIILSWSKKENKHLFYLLVGAFLGFILALLLTLFALKSIASEFDSVVYLMMNLVIYTSLAYGYFHFVNINIASLRIRILHELHNSSDGLLEKDITSYYNVNQIIDNRVKRLVETGQLVKKNDRYFLGPKRFFLFIFWVFEIMKYILLKRGNRLLNDAGYETTINIRYIIQLFWKDQFVRFLFIGGINTVFGYTAYATCVLSGIDYRLSLTISTVLAILFNFNTNGRFVFRAMSSVILIKFIFVNIFIYFLNQALLIFMVTMGFGKLVSQALLLPVIIIVLYGMNKLLVFRAPKKGKS
jgi:putative flippase GtrA